MQSGKIITLGVCLMILFNLLLAFGAVWSLQRMNPEIQQIYQRNVISLSACEEMLVALTKDNVDIHQFRNALLKAQKNITESGEKEALAQVSALFKELESGKEQVRQKLTIKIVSVTHYNREAIRHAAMQAQKKRQAGAWGIVFMTLVFFTAALFFERKLRRTLLLPLQEISQVMEAHQQGDKFRRCSLLYANGDMKRLFTILNALLDRRN